MFTLITGASRGIGKAIATEFAKNGHNLILICKNNIAMLNELANKLNEYNITCHCFKCDIGNYEDVSKLWNNIIKLNLDVDILINNAGISHIGLLQDMSIEEWHNIMNTNLNSIFYITKNVIPHMLAREKGRIINISSVWGDVGASMEVAYSTTKGGVNAFTKSLAKELAPSGICVNAISFGAIDTDMNHNLTPEERKDLEDSIPSSRYGSCEECGKLVFDIAHTSPYLTGEIITMDGAWI